MFKMEEKRLCPKCESENVELQQGNLYGTPGNWVCKDCSFHNVEFPIKEEMKGGKK